MLDFILVAITIAMLASSAYVCKKMISKGTETKEVILEMCGFMTITFGEDHKKTLILTIWVFFWLAVFNYFLPVPMYTISWVAIWSVAWVVQIYIRLTTNLPFGNYSFYGFKVINALKK